MAPGSHLIQYKFGARMLRQDGSPTLTPEYAEHYAFATDEHSARRRIIEDCLAAGYFLEYLTLLSPIKSDKPPGGQKK